MKFSKRIGITINNNFFYPHALSRATLGLVPSTLTEMWDNHIISKQKVKNFPRVIYGCRIEETNAADQKVMKVFDK